MNAPRDNEWREKFDALLHDYQIECVATLDRFAAVAAEKGAVAAFAECAPREWGAPYRPAPSVAEKPPYLCVKVPTGGGKTLIAAASIGPLAARLRIEAPTVLWLAPTGPIVDQTLRALADRENRCRKAVALFFPDSVVNPIALQDARLLSPSDWSAGVNIIVATIQSFRADDKEGLKVYENAGALMRHFRDLPDSVLDGLRDKDGIAAHSLANLLKLRRPIVIVDEAHKACTALSFKTLARFSPSWILEITATPRVRPEGGTAASNVAHQVSAYELKRRDMIKTPIFVQANEDWRETIRLAVGKRAELEKAAQNAGFRPIVLFQAEHAGDNNITVDALRQTLIDDLGIPASQIARATGQHRDEITSDIGTPKCPIRFVITMQKLAEGWDCPPAYVLCSVANLGAAGAVEQLLGRVLRLPGAKRQPPALAAAFVFAAKTNFAQAAKAIAQTLASRHGFSRVEAEEILRDGNLFAAESEEEIVVASAAQKNPLRIPRLVIHLGENIELFEPSHYFLSDPWRAANLDSDLPDFSPDNQATRGKIDIDKSGEILRRPDESETTRTTLFERDWEWTKAGLMAWLTKRIEADDIPAAQVLAFVGAALEGVKKTSKLNDAELAANRHRLASAITRRLGEHRAQRRGKAFQQSLQGTLGGHRLQTSASAALEIRAADYRPAGVSDGVEFRKHLFSTRIGKFDSDEETECAIRIDSMPAVEVWLRNLAGDEARAFWLPTKTDLFYPDFVARLVDGRILVVEYKSKRDWSNDDSIEKRAIGEAWSRLSGETPSCLFVMPKGKDDLAAIDRAIQSRK